MSAPLPPNGLTLRCLGRDEIEQIWTIDRREVVETIYYWRGGQLVRA